MTVRHGVQFPGRVQRNTIALENKESRVKSLSRLVHTYEILLAHEPPDSVTDAMGDPDLMTA